MTTSPVSVETKPAKRRLRLGLRKMMGLVLVLGLIFGGVARFQRQAREVEALTADLARDRIRVNSSDPSLLCLVVMKVLATDSRKAEARCSRWIGPGWFSRPVGFNAGRLKEEKVPHLVERLRRLGTVFEVHFHSATLNGLRLFYIDKIPYGQLGPDRNTCTFRKFPHF